MASQFGEPDASDDRSGIAAEQCNLLASSMWDAPDPARLLCGVIHPGLQDLIHPALPARSGFAEAIDLGSVQSPRQIA